MASGTDYRRLAQHQRGLYFVQPTAAAMASGAAAAAAPCAETAAVAAAEEEQLAARFKELTAAAPTAPARIEVAMGRHLEVPLAAGESGAVWGWGLRAAGCLGQGERLRLRWGLAGRVACCVWVGAVRWLYAGTRGDLAPLAPRHTNTNTNNQHQQGLTAAWCTYHRQGLHVLVRRAVRAAGGGGRLLGTQR